MNITQMRTNLPKLSLMKLFLYVSEWLLLLEDSEAWLAEPRVLFVWHLFFFSSMVLILLPAFVFFLFEPAFANSITLTLIFRWGMVSIIAVVVIPVYATLAALFYKHLLLTGRDLRFSSVVTFWIGWVALFGHLYLQLYFAAPTLITYQHPLFVPTLTMTHLPLLVALDLKAYFYTYSACLATAINFPNIASNSLIVSIINVVEGIGSLLFIALMVATFVGKEIARKHK